MSENKQEGVVATNLQTTVVTENPKCVCPECGPHYQPLLKDGEAWKCPVSGKKYSYDPAEGVPHLIGVETTTVRQPDPEKEEEDFIPQSRRGEQRQIDPAKEPYAGGF